MKEILTVLFICLSLFYCHAQSPNWANIKTTAKPTVQLPNEFDTTGLQIQAHNNLGWEDGIFQAEIDFICMLFIFLEMSSAMHG